MIWIVLVLYLLGAVVTNAAVRGYEALALAARFVPDPGLAARASGFVTQLREVQPYGRWFLVATWPVSTLILIAMSLRSQP